MIVESYWILNDGVIKNEEGIAVIKLNIYFTVCEKIS